MRCEPRNYVIQTDDAGVNGGRHDDISPFRPFPQEIYNPRCSTCPHPGIENLLQRANLRILWFRHTTKLGVHSLHFPILIAVPWNLFWALVFLAIEAVYSIAGGIMADLYSAIRWCVAILVLLGSPIGLAYSPQHFTPWIECVLNIVLFWLALELGNSRAITEAKRLANDRWLPQAESACRHLLTVWRSVKSSRSELADLCATVSRDVSGEDKGQASVLRSALDGRCRVGAQRLDDIGNHLQDAVADWQRFLDANCEGAECVRIGRELTQRRFELEQQMLNENNSCPPPRDFPESSQTKEPNRINEL